MNLLLHRLNVARVAIALTLGLSGLGLSPAIAAPQVVVDIAPIHSITARVMEGAGDPELLLAPGASPHDYALRPSQAERLAAADVVVWMGPTLSPWLEDPLAALAERARILRLDDTPGATRRAVRTGETFAEEPGEGRIDPHLWLDPVNAQVFAADIAAILSTADPENAALYRRNAEDFAQELRMLTDEIAGAIALVRDQPFIVYHDAYQYFEMRFSFPALASVATDEGQAPGAARVAELRSLIRASGAVCAFTEPQFEPALLRTLLEGTKVRTGVLDPLGSDLEPGPALYPGLLRDLGANLVDCLAG